ncbi:MAG TPA: hypothetical protein VNV14_05280 [Opitutaceae bacterium]|nr:hypothetical protein [Opitutaceae bacterium]
MPKAKTNPLLKKLDQLRTELVELAFTLDSRGRFDASDVAMTTSARVGELCEELIQRPTPNIQRRTSKA